MSLNGKKLSWLIMSPSIFSKVHLIKPSCLNLAESLFTIMYKTCLHWLYNYLVIIMIYLQTKYYISIGYNKLKRNEIQKYFQVHNNILVRSTWSDLEQFERKLWLIIFCLLSSTILLGKCLKAIMNFYQYKSKKSQLILTLSLYIYINKKLDTKNRSLGFLRR